MTTPKRLRAPGPTLYARHSAAAVEIELKSPLQAGKTHTTIWQ
jgi:hypothetical protein